LSPASSPRTGTSPCSKSSRRSTGTASSSMPSSAGKSATPSRGHPNGCSSPGSSATGVRWGRRRWPRSPVRSVPRNWSAINWYFSPDNVAEANDKILVLMDRLRLPQLCRRHEDQLHTSSDGQKVEVGVDSLHAQPSFKYFGRGKGASAYTFIDERHFQY